MAKAPAKKRSRKPKTISRHRPLADDGVKQFGKNEMSAYKAAIDCLDDFSRALGGVPYKNRDSELNALFHQWSGDRAGVIERYERMMQRGG